MNIAVRYYTRSGNTRKLAEAIAEAVSAEAKDVTSPLTERADILFLGCSYYAFDIDEAVKRFLTENAANIGRIVCFGTSAMMSSMKKPVGKAAAPLGLEVAAEEFHCRGEFKLFHKGRPNDEDAISAAAFAKGVIKK